MEIDALLADFAQVAEGKLYISGAAINTVWAAADPPYGINVYVAAVVEVPYTATNEPHVVNVSLIDEDGQAVGPWSPDGSPMMPIALSTTFNMGRPPLLPAGESQAVPLAFGIQVPLGRMGLYHFSISIDDEEIKRLPLRILLRQS